MYEKHRKTAEHKLKEKLYRTKHEQETEIKKLDCVPFWHDPNLMEKNYLPYGRVWNEYVDRCDLCQQKFKDPSQLADHAVSEHEQYNAVRAIPMTEAQY